MCTKEICDLYDIYGNKIGKTFVRGCPISSGEFAMVVDIWIVNSSDQILIQKRSAQKKDMPNTWATHSGCVQSGETSIHACIRESGEEIGIKIHPKHIQKLNRKIHGKLLSENFIVQQEFDLENAVLQLEEVSALQWVTPQQLKQMADERKFYQYPELTDVFNFLEQRAKRRKPKTPL